MELNSRKCLDKSLFEAIQDEDYERVALLLKNGANPNHLFTRYGGVSSFHIAVGLDDDISFTKLFIFYNADVNIRSLNEKWTPLHVCAYHNKPDSLDYLLSRKADPYLVDYQGKTAFEIAIEQENVECAEIIERHETKNGEININSKKPTRKLSSSSITSSIISDDLNNNNDENFSNFKTSTFDESKLEKFLNQCYTEDEDKEEKIIKQKISDESTVVIDDSLISHDNSTVLFKNDALIKQNSNQNPLEKDYSVLTYVTAETNVICHRRDEKFMNVVELEREIDEIYANINSTTTNLNIYKEKNYSKELLQELTEKLEMSCTSDVIEARMFTCFKESPIDHASNKEWREGIQKSAFNYLLIDPRITLNLPIRAKNLRKRDAFRIFVSSIFYIGKGSRARPYAHLHDSLKYWKSIAPSNKNLPTPTPLDKHDRVIKKSNKVDKIIDIWNNNFGVVSLHCFQSVIPTEAYTREAAMIDAIGMHNLTNMKKGNYYGEAKTWNEKKRCELGTVLLRRACAIFLAEGERQIMPKDL